MISRNEALNTTAINLLSDLSPMFLTPAPVDECSPDWVILKQEDIPQKIYMNRETKSTPKEELLRPTEVAKIKCCKKHFAAIVIDDYAKASPLSWRLH